jgi:hypothetical protein
MEVIQRANRDFRRLQISGFMERGMNHPFMNSLAKHLRNVAHLVTRDLRFALRPVDFILFARARNDVNYRYLRKNISDAKRKIISRRYLPQIWRNHTEVSIIYDFHYPLSRQKMKD